MKECTLRLMLLNGSILSYLFAAQPTTAQIVPDTTLPVNSTVTPTGDTSVIEGGTKAGSNLFHSFSEFSVPTGGTAEFNNTLDVQNILTRVTGGKISNIDGLIRAYGTANLFLINPNGIIFGQGARLDIGGSFFGSTANSINFADRFQFSATNPQASPLLTVSVPIGLQMGTSGNIVNSSRAIDSSGNLVGLSVQPGETLGLVGGEVAIAGGYLSAFPGRVELGSVAANNTVSLTPTNPGWVLSYQGISNFQDFSLTDGGAIAVAGDGRGSIAINAKNIDIRGGSLLEAGINLDSQFLGTQAGDIALNASGIVSINNSTIINEVFGNGNVGNININGRSLFLTDGAQLSTTSFGQGNAGNVTINALDTFSLNGLGNSEETRIDANLEGTGKGGNISINAPKVSVLNGATIVTNTLGQGDAGNIEITATDNILIDGADTTSSGVGSQVFPDAVGNGGAIALNAPRVSVTGGANVVAHTNGQGNAGSIEINATKVFLNGQASNGESSGLGSAVFELGKGNAGQIVINTDSLDVTDSATLFVTSFGKGDAGNITINAKGAVLFDGVGSNGRSSNAFSTVEQGAFGNGREINITANLLSVQNGAVIGATTRGQGNGGNINVNVNTLNVLNGSQILTTSRSNGNAGNITVKATDSITLSSSDPTFSDRLTRMGRRFVRNQSAASGLFADTDVNSTGKGGDINVLTRSLFLSDGAQINASTLGQGNSGDVTIDSGYLSLNNSAIAAYSLSGQGGNINLRGLDLSLLRNNSTISTRAGTEESGGGNGGNIAIDTAILAALENSNINANAFQGRGGNIQIEATGLFRSPDSAITATSQIGINGSVRINTPEVEPSRGLVELPAEIIAPANLIANSCIARRSKGQGSFIITGTGGLPTLPDDPANSSFQTYTVPSGQGVQGSEGEKPLPQASRLKPVASYPQVEATGFYRLASGQQFLGRKCP